MNTVIDEGQTFILLDSDKELESLLPCWPGMTYAEAEVRAAQGGLQLGHAIVRFADMDAAEAEAWPGNPFRQEG